MTASRAGWASVKLGEVVKLKTGPFGSALHKSDYVRGGVPLINPSHIRRGRLEPNPSVSVQEAAQSRLSEYQLQVNDVVMYRRARRAGCVALARLSCARSLRSVRTSFSAFFPLRRPSTSSTAIPLAQRW